MSPFDAARYARLLEGLEVTEVLLSYANANNDIVRIDSEYFKKQHLQDEALRRRRAYRRLGDMGAQVRSFGAYSLNNEVEYVSAGVPFVRGVNMKNGRVGFSDMQYIRPEAHRLLWKSEVKEGMVLLSMSGTIGDVAIATASWPYPVNSNQDIAKIETRGACNPFVLYAFLLSQYGQSYLKREARGSVQQHVFLSQIEQLEVPDFGAVLGRRLQEVIVDSECHQLSAESQQRSAQETLLHALGLDGWNAPEPLSYVRRSSEAFGAERFDAEYFHPQKASALLALRSLSDATVGDLFSSVRQLWQPDAGSPSDLVRNYDLNDALVPFLDGNKSPVARSEIASTKKLLKAGDLVVSRLRSYLREIAIVEPSAEFPMVASTEYIVLRPRSDTAVPVEALLVYLRSPLPQIVLKWSQDGSNHPRFDEKEILRMPVPRALIADPAPYVNAMQRLKASKQRAGELLAAATRAVEIAIEDSEAAALAYLDQVAPHAH